MTWTNNFWSDRNFTWYFSVSEVNTSLVSGNFQNYRVVQPILDFWISLAIDFLENKIGVELRYNGLPKRACKIPIYVTCEKVIVENYGKMWGLIKKKKK